MQQISAKYCDDAFDTCFFYLIGYSLCMLHYFLKQFEQLLTGYRQSTNEEKSSLTRWMTGQTNEIARQPHIANNDNMKQWNEEKKCQYKQKSVEWESEIAREIERERKKEQQVKKIRL